MKALLRKYKPALLFVAKFVACYIIMNLLYAVYIESYRPKVDPVTSFVTKQTSVVLRIVGYETDTRASESKPNEVIYDKKHGGVLSVYEGCNGLNVMIIFVAFLVAFKWNKNNLWFIPLGLLLIHLSNLLRIFLLYIVSIQLPDFLYFSHKYLFTASIFMVTFALWYWWIKKIHSV